MQANFDHNKLLKTISKGRLKPQGIVQKGNSRTFLYDGGWYVIVIEFQPSSWGKGSFLNIGIDLNFYPREYFTFSYGYREKDFSSVESEEQFAELINSYCDYTIQRVQTLKESLKDIRTAVGTIHDRSFKDDPWDYFDLAILYGLTGQIKLAKSFLNKLKDMACTHDYEFERQKVAIELVDIADDIEKFVERVNKLLAQTRLLKKLPSIEVKLILTEYKTPKTSFFKSLFGKK